MQRRKGLSEVLGALILTIIMVGVLSTMYIAGNTIENRIKNAGREAARSIMLARNPPRLELITTNSTVYALIRGSGVPVQLESIIVLTQDGRESHISIGKTLRPGEELRIPLYPAPCKPTRVVLATLSSGYLLYPENGTWFCQPYDREKITEPDTGEELDPVPIQVPLDPIGSNTPDHTLRLNLKIVGSVTRSGPPPREAIRIFVNGTLAGQLSQRSPGPVTLAKIGSGALQLWPYTVDDTVYMLVLSYVSAAERWIIVARANATMDFSASTRTTDVCGRGTWTLPLVYGAITRELRVQGTCTISAQIEGSLSMSGVSLSSESFVLLLSTNSRPASISANYTLELSLYRADTGCSRMHASLPPGYVTMGFERPRLWLVPASILSAVNQYLHMVVDPFRAAIIVGDPEGRLLGNYTVDAVHAIGFANAGKPLWASICVSQTLPASNSSIFIVKTIKIDNYNVTIHAWTEDGRIAQPWAFPGILRISINNQSKAFIIYQKPLMAGAGPLATLFPLEELYGNTSTVYAKRLNSSDMTYTTWPSIRGGSVVEQLDLPVRGRDLEAIAGAPGVVLIYWRAGALETPIGSLDAYAGIVIWVN